MDELGKIIASVKIDIKNSLIYIGNFILTYATYILAMVIQVTFWKAIYVAGTEEQFANASVSATVIGDYYLSEMLIYIMFIYLFAGCTAAVDIKDQMKNDIMNGEINIQLIRPIHYILYRWCLTISKQLFTIILSVIVIYLYVKMHNLSINTNFSIMFVFIIFVLFALSISFLFSMIIGELSFWLQETSSISVIFGAIVQFLSGGLIPLDYFGSGGNKIIQYSPFTYMAYFPAQIILKRVDFYEIFRGGIIAVIWIIFLSMIAYNLWKKGVCKYSAIGG